MNSVVKMQVSTPRQFDNAIRLSQNAFLKKTVIMIYNHDSKIRGSSAMLRDIYDRIRSSYDVTSGCFADAQIMKYAYSVKHDFWGRFCETTIDTVFFNSSKELNDLICVSAEIAELLNKKLCDQTDEFNKIMVFAKWIKRYFEYKDNNTIGDHAAFELLMSGTGVCQAISAMALMVLNYMGIKALYVSGMGRGNKGWEPHAWNVVKIGDRWIHVDFTFFFDSIFLPNTLSVSSERDFLRKHLWEKKEYSKKKLESKWDNITSTGKKLFLVINDTNSLIDGVKVTFERPLLLLWNDMLLIDLSSIIRILGGGMEVIPETGYMNICINNERITVKNGMKNCFDGYFDARILNVFSNAYMCSENELIIEI